MLKEEYIIYEEFSNLFKENDNRLWFHRFRTQVLAPYFQLENGKEVLLKFIEIIKNDSNKDNLYTILKTKPSQFKTSFQEDYGFDSLPKKAKNASSFRAGMTLLQVHSICQNQKNLWCVVQKAIIDRFRNF